MQSLNITLTERELTVLLDALHIAMEEKDDDSDLPSMSRLFDRLSEVAYDMWDEEEA